MKKKLLSFGLLAAGLLTAGNVMADDITAFPSSYDFTNSESSTISPFDNGAITKGTNVTGIKFSQGSAVTSSAYFDFDTDGTSDDKVPYTLGSSDKVTITFVMYEGWLSGGQTCTIDLYNSKGTSLIGYSYSLSGCNVTDVRFGGTTASTYSSFSGQSAYSTSGNANGWAPNKQPFVTTDNFNPTVTMTISGSGSVTLTWSKTGGKVSVTQSFSGSLSDDVTLDLAKFVVYDASTNADRSLGMASLSLSKETVSEAKYTLKKVCGDTELSSEELADEIGTTPELSTDDIWVDGVKYLYSSNDAETVGGIDEDGSTVYTITYTAASQYTVTLQSQDAESNSIADDITGTVYSGEAITLYYPKYVLYNGIYYGIDQKSEPYYGYTFSSVEENKTQVLSYTASDITYYTECEDMTVSSSVSSGTYPNRYSNGTICRLGKSATATTKDVLEAGTYTIVIYGRNNSSSTAGSLNIAYIPSGSTEATVLAESAVTWEGGKTGERTCEITLPEAGNIQLINPSSDYNSNIELDYMTATKAATAETITCGSYTYKSYCSSNALEFDEDGDYMAYTATYSTDATAGTITVTLEKCASVPANTGVIIYNKNNVTYSEIAFGSATSTENENALVGVTEDKTLSQIDGENTNFILWTDGTFVKVKDGTTLGANRAYLPIKTSDIPASGAKINIVFADDATGINEVNAAAKSGKIYNLQGIEVKNATNGLYIVNGKKVIK